MIATRTNSQSRVLHSILNKLGIDADGKAEMVYQVSDGRTSKSSELSFLEMKTLIDKLNELSKGQINTTAESNNKMRRAILSCCYTMHWTNNDGVDYDRLDNFLLTSGVVKKKLNDLNHDELVLVTSQFKQMEKKEYK